MGLVFKVYRLNHLLLMPLAFLRRSCPQVYYALRELLHKMCCNHAIYKLHILAALYRLWSKPIRLAITIGSNAEHAFKSPTHSFIHEAKACLEACEIIASSPSPNPGTHQSPQVCKPEALDSQLSPEPYKDQARYTPLPIFANWYIVNSMHRGPQKRPHYMIVLIIGTPI